MSDEIITTVKGCLPDKPDDRDFEIERLLFRFPVAVSALSPTVKEFKIPEHTPISNQMRLGSCVSNAVCDAYEIVTGIQYGPREVKQIARRLNYFGSRSYHNATDRDSGTAPRYALKSGHKVGFVEEQYYPYTDDLKANTTAPPLDVLTMASNTRINSYYALTTSGDALLKQIMSCIINMHPVVFCTPVNRDFQAYRGENKVFYEFLSSVGNHAMIWSGFRIRDDTVDLWTRNSWGAWGNKGHCWINERALKNCFGMWCLSDMEIL